MQVLLVASILAMHSDLAVLITGCSNRFLLEELCKGVLSHNAADVYIELNPDCLVPITPGLHMDRNARFSEASIRERINATKGTLRYLRIGNEFNVKKGPETAGRMSQYNVWSKPGSLPWTQGHAILRRWQGASRLYKKTRGVHKHVLWVREDQAWLKPFRVLDIADVVVRSCKPFGGISDKVMLFNQIAALRLLPNLLNLFFYAPPHLLTQHNPESILLDMIRVMGLTVKSSPDLSLVRRARKGRGYLLQTFLRV